MGGYNGRNLSLRFWTTSLKMCQLHLLYCSCPWPYNMWALSLSAFHRADQACSLLYSVLHSAMAQAQAQVQAQAQAGKLAQVLYIVSWNTPLKTKSVMSAAICTEKDILVSDPLHCRAAVRDRQLEARAKKILLGRTSNTCRLGLPPVPSAPPSLFSCPR